MEVIIGKSKVKKAQRTVRLFSNLEYENWLLVETNPNIISFCEQPFITEVRIDNKKRKSIFDMWIQYANEVEEFREVKYSSDLIVSKEQIHIQREWCN